MINDVGLINHCVIIADISDARPSMCIALNNINTRIQTEVFQLEKHRRSFGM